MWQSKGFSPPHQFQFYLCSLPLVMFFGPQKVIGNVETCSVDQDCSERIYCLVGLCIGTCIACSDLNREDPVLLPHCARSFADCGPCKPGYLPSEDFDMTSYWCSLDENVNVDSVNSASYLVYCFVAIFFVIILTAASDLVRKFRQPSGDKKVTDPVIEESFDAANDELDFAAEIEEEFSPFIVHRISYDDLDQAVPIPEDELMEERFYSSTVSIDEDDNYSNASTLPEDDLSWRRNLETFYGDSQWPHIYSSDSINLH